MLIEPLMTSLLQYMFPSKPKKQIWRLVIVTALGESAVRTIDS